MKCPSCQAENQADSRFCARCATPLPQDSASASSEITRTMIASIDHLQRGALFAGRYEIIEEIGRGGMGRVYKAFDRQIKEVIALKLLKPEIGFNEKAVERFRNELKFARRIAHPRVCRMYDLGESGLSHFLTMEYVEGEDLKAFIRRSDHLTTAKAVNIGRQIAEGLAEAHRLGVVHRDLKPQNVMIDREGKAKIMDFGLARFAESDGLTGSGLMLGTPEYMSPEQVDLKEVDARVDIYALGIILYEMVTGHVPFKGETPLSVAMKQKSEKARDARESNPLVPDSLIAVIKKCLEKDPKLRYQTAAEAGAALDEVERGLPSATREISRTAARGSSAHLRRRRLKWLWAIPPGLVVIAVMGLLMINEKHVATSNVPAGPAEPEISPLTHLDEAALAGKAIIGFLGSKDPKNVEDLEKTLDEVRKFLPEKGVSVDAWNQAQEKIRQSRVKGQAPASAPELRGEMQQLMGLISERESAQKARDQMAVTKSRAEDEGADDKYFLFRVAQFEETNADDAFDKNDYLGSRSLYRLLERMYAASPRGKDPVKGVAVLREIVKALKSENRAVPAEKIDDWLASSAREIEAQAETFASKNDLENACGAFTRAAYLLQKIKDAA
ncbi:MAG: serine/threonine-protein kinase [Candidatus Aminicenantales bacterium]